eukprot:978212-Prymnesium_polylepis.1
MPYARAARRRALLQLRRPRQGAAAGAPLAAQPSKRARQAGVRHLWRRGVEIGGGNRGWK